MESTSPGYQLGHDEAELERLNRQGSLLAPATRLLLQAAGIGAGMRVLDLGSGAGDVTFLAADLVGADGEVVGLERSPDAVATAERSSPVRLCEHEAWRPGRLQRGAGPVHRWRGSWLRSPPSSGAPMRAGCAR